MSPFFEKFIITVVLFNIALMICNNEYFTLNSAVFDALNQLMLSIYVCELSLKIFGLGVTLFVVDKMNILDSIIVLVAVLELYLQTSFA